MHPILFATNDFALLSYDFFLMSAILMGIYIYSRNSTKNTIPALYFFAIVPWALLGAGLMQWMIAPSKKIAFIFYGGVFFGLMASFVICRIKKFSLGSTLNAVVPAVALAHAIGRIGCFLNGCCFGKFCLLANSSFRHPTQLYESIFLVGLFFYLQKRLHSSNNNAARYALVYSLFRFFIEFLRDDPERGFLWSLSSSQYLSLLLFVWALLLDLKATKDHKQGHENPS